MKRFFPDTDDRTEYDLIVIGGGITGAAAAHEATLAGLNVVLFEKGDFGGATSAATSKLIHGGLRYLKTMEFGLVRESLRERRILEDIAPNFVYPLPFIVPHYKTSEKWILSAGLTLYDLLAFDRGWTIHRSKRIPSHQRLSVKEVRGYAPLLPAKGLVGGKLYYDCQSIFPERLTLAFIKSAAAGGARVANYAQVDDFLHHEEGKARRITGVRVRDLTSGEVREVRGKLVLNSGGPWADSLLRRAGETGPGTDGGEKGRLRMSEGIHIIVPKLIEEEAALVLLTPRGRHFFVLPWRGYSLIGTTDKAFVGNPDEYCVTRESIEEFIDEINATFQGDSLKYEDVIFAYGGLRPLTDTQTESTYTSSRKYEIFDGAATGLPGLLTVEGGKYTTSRNLAQTVMKKIGRMLPGAIRFPVHSARRPLFGCEIPHMSVFLRKIRDEYPDFPATTLEYIARNYGTEYREVLEIARTNSELREPLNQDGEIAAQIVFAARHEMAQNLEDIMLRRTGLGTLGLPPEEVLAKIADAVMPALGLNREEMDRQLDQLRAQLRLPA